MSGPCLSIPSEQLIPILQDILLVPHHSTNPNNDKEADSDLNATQDGALSSTSSSLTLADARQIIERCISDNANLSPSENATVSLNVITAVKRLNQISSTDGHSTSGIQSHDLLLRLEQCLAYTQTQLTFPNNNTTNTKTHKSTTPPTQEQIKFRKRMERLKLAQQERSYTKLTSNLDLNDAPDTSIKSLMYATSVGLNMIVAPLSFGTFMYFFAGKIFGWVLGDDKSSSSNSATGNVDMKGLIAGVVSGVIMLFIEMILFVIRNHEMDKAITKKSKNEKANPFGYVKSKAQRTFHG